MNDRETLLRMASDAGLRCSDIDEIVKVMRFYFVVSAAERKAYINACIAAAKGSLYCQDFNACIDSIRAMAPPLKSTNVKL